MKYFRIHNFAILCIFILYVFDHGYLEIIFGYEIIDEASFSGLIRLVYIDVEFHYIEIINNLKYTSTEYLVFNNEQYWQNNCNVK